MPVLSDHELLVKLAADEQITDADLDLINTTSIALGSLFAQEVDIHIHTVKIGQDCRNVLLLNDDRYLLSEPTIESLEVTISEITEYCMGKSSVVGILGIISASSGVENETGLDIKLMLRKVWALTKNPILAANHSHMGLVTEVLNQNVETGGGCLAGISARLVSAYSLFIEHIASQTHRIQEIARKEGAAVVVSGLPRLEVSEDEMIRLAVADSLSIYSSRGAAETLVGDDDAELTEVRYESLVTMLLYDGATQETAELIATTQIFSDGRSSFKPNF
ncbi:MAG: hypothetical protein HOI53_02860 [Francisellaceae bacterium]|nr:hypothetical protein [Francisellaceae bacterium]MBT6206945.1 hypothetical protein [Francisellaceae bacterium]MBT6539267.1 hypothetical protein [Francisellaceae bacterium]